MPSTTLGRTLRNVLDVGCGEGNLARAATGIAARHCISRARCQRVRAVARYGRSRNIGLARFGQLEQLRFDTRFDLIVCTDVLHYLKPAEIRAGLHGISEMLEGIAFLEVYSPIATMWLAIIMASSHAHRHGTCVEFGEARPPGVRLALLSGTATGTSHIAALERAQLPA
jgi:2-polyprenyl-3-methyl-5-hydroxy-6-metoxy-1,4-benzoquinol methylase